MRKVLKGLWFAVTYEIGTWRSLLRWIFRRPPTRDPGARVFPYAAVLTPLYLAFIGVSAVELPVAHLLVPWPTVRLVLDVIGVYGLLWMIGALASHRVNPHVVSDLGLRARSGTTIDILVPVEAISTVRVRNRTYERGRALQVDGEAICVVQLKQTNVDVTLREPMVLTPKAGPVTEVRVAVDDPKALAAALSARLGKVAA